MACESDGKMKLEGGTYYDLLFILMTIMLLGRRPDDEGVEDNGLEEDSGDGQVCEAGFDGK